MTADKTAARHLAKEVPPRKVVVRGVTITIDPEIFDDLEMLECLYDIQHAEDDPNGSLEIIPFLRRMCGKSYTAVKKALKDPVTGRIDGDTLSGFLTELLSAIAPNS